MSDTAQELVLLGDALQQAWRNDARVHRSSRLRRAVPIALAALAILAGTGAAIAAITLKSSAQEAHGLIEGWTLFAGSEPRCTQLTAGSFRCLLAKPPTGMAFYDQHGHRLWNQFLGLRAETVDASHHVDGACLSTQADGRSWECFLGDEAVRRGFLAKGRMGAYLPVPPAA
jgi:hypothetical protein